MSQEATDQNFADKVIAVSKTKPVLVDFWAAWCGPCRAMGPVIDEVAAAVGDSAGVCKVNVDENPEMSAKYAIQSIPSLKIFRDGEVVAEFVGGQSRETLVAALNEHK